MSLVNTTKLLVRVHLIVSGYHCLSWLSVCTLLRQDCLIESTSLKRKLLYIPRGQIIVLIWVPIRSVLILHQRFRSVSGLHSCRWLPLLFAFFRFLICSLCCDRMSCEELFVSAWPCMFFGFGGLSQWQSQAYEKSTSLVGFISAKRSTILHKWFQLPPSPTSGTHKVKYHAREDRDFQLHVDHLPIDLTLIIPHYRAHNQPVDHKLSMDIRTQSASTKLKVVRLPSSKLDFRPADSISALVSEYVVV